LLCFPFIKKCIPIYRFGYKSMNRAHPPSSPT
jgi:hypothetical protein